MVTKCQKLLTAFGSGCCSCAASAEADRWEEIGGRRSHEMAAAAAAHREPQVERIGHQI